MKTSREDKWSWRCGNACYPGILNNPTYIDSQLTFLHLTANIRPIVLSLAS